jgi:hypothetical protein
MRCNVTIHAIETCTECYDNTFLRSGIRGGTEDVFLELDFEG